MLNIQNLVYHWEDIGGISLSQQINKRVCFFVFQMRGHTANTRLGQELQMERWPSGGKVYQVRRAFIIPLLLNSLCPL